MKFASQKEFETFVSTLKEPAWMTDYRRECFKKITSTVSLPDHTGVYESYSQIDGPEINSIERPQVAYDALSGIEAHSYSSKDVLPDSPILKQVMSLDWNFGKQPQALHYFNQAFTTNIVLIKIPPGISTEKPIEILYPENNSSYIVTIFVIAEKGAKASILSIKTGSKLGYVAEQIRVLAEQESSVTFTSIQYLDGDAMSVNNHSCICMKDSSVKWLNACLGARNTKCELSILLKEPGAEIDCGSVFLARKNCRIHTSTYGRNGAKNTKSRLITRGAVYENARVYADGLIKIDQTAHGSDAYLRHDVLLLDDDSQAFSLPELEIDNHDVKCSHASTIGQLDKDKIFYLMSRGISEESAKLLIIEGFFGPVLESVKNKKLRIKLKHAIREANS